MGVEHLHSLPEFRPAGTGVLRALALNIALSYEGQEEVPRGSNAGKFVEDTLRFVGLGKGNSWCMAFVFRCFAEAAAKLKIANTCYKTAGVLACWNNTPPGRWIKKKDATAKNILPGYQFIYNHGEGHGHTGLVVAVRADGKFETIEGNTDPAGSSNGYGTFKRVRSLKDAHLQGFIIY